MSLPSAVRPVPPLMRLLLVLAAAGAAAALLAGAGWYRSAHRAIQLEDLEPSERQRLVEKAMADSPGVFEPAWYEPRIGYTLKRASTVESWEDRFRTNEIGFRTGALAKRPGVFRIVFLGDSVAYGMGERESDSFPKALERLAAGHGPGSRGVESWTLALPGYNLMSAIAAFEFWEDALAADAVVLVPSSNDNESTPHVAPNGQVFYGSAGLPDVLGEAHDWQGFGVLYDGHRALSRWRSSFDRVRALELHLKSRGIPFSMLFVVRWQVPVVHRFVAESGIEAPYAVVPAKLTEGEWLNDLASPHPNARAGRLYARIVHRLLERQLGWPALPDREPLADSVPLFDRVPPRVRWEAAAHELLRTGTRQSIRESFSAGREWAKSWAGPGDPGTGIFGRATTLLVHPPAGTASLEIRVRRLDTLESNYPLGLEVSIPSASGGTRVRTSVPAEGPAEHVFRIAVPADRDGDQALEVLFVADRVGSEPPALRAKSLAITSIRAAN